MENHMISWSNGPMVNSKPDSRKSPGIYTVHNSLLTLCYFIFDVSCICVMRVYECMFQHVCVHISANVWTPGSPRWMLGTILQLFNTLFMEAEFLDQPRGHRCDWSPSQLVLWLSCVFLPRLGLLVGCPGHLNSSPLSSMEKVWLALWTIIPQSPSTF